MQCAMAQPPALYRLSPLSSSNGSPHRHCFLCRIRECLSRIFLVPEWKSFGLRLDVFSPPLKPSFFEMEQNCDRIWNSCTNCRPAGFCSLSVTPQHSNMLFFPLLHLEIFKKLQSSWIEQHSYCEEVLHISMYRRYRRGCIEHQPLSQKQTLVNSHCS
jgi:hypothetical protein